MGYIKSIIIAVSFFFFMRKMHYGPVLSLNISQCGNTISLISSSQITVTLRKLRR